MCGGNSLQDGSTALHTAVDQGYIGVVKLLASYTEFFEEVDVVSNR